MNSLLIQPASACMTGVARCLFPYLQGWLEATVSADEWLVAGGPLDATDKLPMGGAWRFLDDGRPGSMSVIGHSVFRAGALG